MLIKVDAKALEWRVAAYLSQDAVAIEEIKNGVDIHEENRKHFNLPSRLIAKTFIFRLIFGGTEYSYAKDPEFTEVSRDPEFWKEIIDGTYRKYSGLARWHEDLVRRAISDGCITTPTGRRFTFSSYRDNRGNLKWPRTTILNYPVQGTSADLMMIARISAKKRLKKYGDRVLLVNTVHDSIELDVNLGVDKDYELCYNVCTVLEEVFKDIPSNFKKLYKEEFNVPLLGEVSFGNNLLNMKEFKHDHREDQFHG